MIITRTWLEEWMSLSNITTSEIEKKLNSIGLEVDARKEYKIPNGVVVGKVLECIKHPEADKLNICQVNVGTGIRKIICGAKNIAKDQFVPVAMIGTIMPDGLKIKPIKLRGIDSEGMICSSTEINLPKLNDGILVLDDSIGCLELGKPLNEYKVLNDDVIEIELTANRGDCLSIYGIARDLCASFDTSLNDFLPLEDSDSSIGVGRILQITNDSVDSVDVQYRVIRCDRFEIPLKISYRLALIDKERNGIVDDTNNNIESILFYATYTTGVVLKRYSKNYFSNDETKARIHLKNDENGVVNIIGKGSKKVATIGINQDENSKPTNEDLIQIVEASYIHPDRVSRIVYEQKLTTDHHFYRTSRGSEPNLSFGMDYFHSLLKQYSGVKFYAGCNELSAVRKRISINLNLDFLTSFIGYKVEATKIAKILRNLQFGIISSSDNVIVLKVPLFREDILRKQDVAEEIIRMIGIDNIPSKKLIFAENEHNSITSKICKTKRKLRTSSIVNGFDESVHFVFTEEKKANELGFKTIVKEKKLLNPITETLDTLRPTLLLNLLNASEANFKFGQKTVALFEVGSVFNENREESQKVAFIYSGQKERENITNHANASFIDLETFTYKISSIIGAFKLVPTTQNNALIHPFVNADIIKGRKKIGWLSKLHLSVQNDLGIPDTFIAEIDFDSLDFDLGKAIAYSKYQAVYRDLSIVVEKNITLTQIENTLNKLDDTIMKNFTIIDRYTDEKLDNKMSLTLRFKLQSLDKTLEEEDINPYIDTILAHLAQDVNAELR